MPQFFKINLRRSLILFSCVFVIPTTTLLASANDRMDRCELLLAEAAETIVSLTARVQNLESQLAILTKSSEGDTALHPGSEVLEKENTLTDWGDYIGAPPEKILKITVDQLADLFGSEEIARWKSEGIQTLGDIGIQDPLFNFSDRFVNLLNMFRVQTLRNLSEMREEVLSDIASEHRAPDLLTSIGQLLARFEIRKVNNDLPKPWTYSGMVLYSKTYSIFEFNRDGLSSADHLLPSQLGFSTDEIGHRLFSESSVAGLVRAIAVQGEHFWTRKGLAPLFRKEVESVLAFYQFERLLRQ